MDAKKRALIMDVAELSSKGEKTPQEDFNKVIPKRRAIMTTDDDEAFIEKYYSGRTDCFRALLREDKIKKGWLR